MYELPLFSDVIGADESAEGSSPSSATTGARFGIPLHEHTAFMLVSGLLHEDVDDQHDTIRGALEIDPLLATWAVHVADRSDVQLTSFSTAVRWLVDSLHRFIAVPDRLASSQPLPVATRAAWRSITTEAVGCARIARRSAETAGLSNASSAFWLGMLCSAKSQLDQFATQNGHSPLHGFTLTWPRWLQEFEAKTNTTNSASVAACVRDAIRSKSSDLAVVSREERELWFRPYPEFRSLVPSLLKKLKRLNRLEEQFAEALQKEKLAALQQLAYGASHEINNPLANISTRAQTLVYNEQDADRRKKLLAINQQAFRAYEMIADLMLFAKPPRLEIAEFSVNQVLGQIQNELAGDTAKDNIRVDLIVRNEEVGEPLRCLGDSVQIAAALKAICVNGVEAMEPGGQLTIEASLNHQSKCIEVSVEDSGAGLSEIAQRHLFDPFFSGREAGRGLGFGLSKAWRIVEQHHGRIEVSSQPNRGCRFTVILPQKHDALSCLKNGNQEPTNNRDSNGSHASSNEQESANASI